MHANICSMSVSYPVSRAALDRGDLPRVMALARQMPPMRLDDALRVVLLLRDGAEERYEAACVRWAGRFALEGRAVTISDLRLVFDALDDLPTAPGEAMERLQMLCLARGLA